MNKRTRTTLFALGLAIAGGAQAYDATEFSTPTGSSLTRAEVVAQTRMAQAAGELRVDEIRFRVTAPDTSLLSRDQVRLQAIEAMESRPYGDRTVAGSYFTGGM